MPRRSAARLRKGLAMLPRLVTATVAADRTSNCRRVNPRLARIAIVMEPPSSNHDERCPLNLTPDLRFYDRWMTRNEGGEPHRCQLQMPPDLHGQVWIRVSRACASSGLLWRFASLTRAAPRGRSTCATITLVVRTTVLRSADCSARAGARSAFASIGTGANSVSGPSRFGESTALERSRPRNSSARYSSAIAGTSDIKSPTQRATAKALFRTICGLLK